MSAVIIRCIILLKDRECGERGSRFHRVAFVEGTRFVRGMRGRAMRKQMRGWVVWGLGKPDNRFLFSRRMLLCIGRKQKRMNL